MDTGIILLIAALVIVAVAGPAIGFLFAQTRARGKSARPYAESMGFAPAAPPPPADYRDPAWSHPAAQAGIAARPVSSPPADNLGRFASEPPLFGDEAPLPLPPEFTSAPRPDARPASHDEPEAPASEPRAPAPPPREAVRRPTPPARPSEAEPSRPEQNQGPKDTKPNFRSVADLVDDAMAERLSWLDRLSAGRRLQLHRLGYDLPEKIAHLRKGEITRLARLIDVTEDEIVSYWMPEARRQLEKKTRSDRTD